MHQKIQDLVIFMTIIIIWESFEIGWDNPKLLVMRILAITIIGTILWEVLSFFWKHSHFKR